MCNSVSKASPHFQNLMKLILFLFPKEFENKKGVYEMQLALFKKMVFEPVRVKETASLTNCTSPDMPLCEKNPHGSTVPEYMAEERELMYKRLPAIAPPLFKSAFYRIVCTYPTGTSDCRLQGYLTKDQCVDAFMQWYD